MARDYTIVEIPGRSKYRIAVTNSFEEDGKNKYGVKSPEWMVQIDDLLTSDVENYENYENYAELYGWYGESSRFTAPDISNGLFTSASLKHSELILLIPNGGYAAELENHMYQGIPIEELCIVRLGHVRQMKVELQNIYYTICHIQKFQQQLDKVYLHLTVTTKVNTIHVFNVAGEKQGQVVSRVDFARNIAES